MYHIISNKSMENESSPYINHSKLEKLVNQYSWEQVL